MIPQIRAKTKLKLGQKSMVAGTLRGIQSPIVGRGLRAPSSSCWSGFQPRFLPLERSLTL